MRSYFITGINRGIGLGLATQLLRAGNQVLGTTRNKEVQSLKELSQKYGNQVRVFAMNVTDEKEVKEVAKEVENLDVLINNAAILENYDRKVYEIEPSQVMRTFDVNVLGPLRVIQALLPALKKSQQPLIANISSRVGSIADNESGKNTSYRVSKAALNMLNKNLSIELKPFNIACVVLHPGWVKTDMGGPDALIDSQTSVQGLIQVMEKLSMKDTGKFYNYLGEPLPW